MRRTIHMIVNGALVQLEIEPHWTLLWVLREKLDLLGVREGCSTGECGACTVLKDGRPVPSCLVLAPDVDGAKVVTVEGLAQDGRLHRLQEAFVKHGAIQCGYCTSGMILAALGAPPGTDPARAVEGNLCRCTGYAKILTAIGEGLE